MTRKIFSIPLNPKLNTQEFFDFLNFCQDYKDWIADVYVTLRIPPFHQDAMGDVIILEEAKLSLIESAMNLYNSTGIAISATFNNIQVPPTQKNLDIFIKSYQKLYSLGIKTLVVPHTHWVATGQIQAAFPGIYIKNTILRDVHTAQEIVNLAKYGFDYINLDRDLMRDKEKLLEIKRAKEFVKKEYGKDIAISLLANEGCVGQCPMMVEHFEYNNNRAENMPQYFYDPISRTTCPKWDVEDPAIALKTANFSPWKADWDYYLDELGIDIFKMHGREDKGRLQETMTLISRYVNEETFVDPGFEQWCEETNVVGKPIELWREKIRTCRFECWDCQYCDKIHDKKSSLDFTPLIKHVAKSIADSGVPKIFVNVPGLTSPRVQTLINHIASGVGTYMEVGSYLGATAIAALKNNTIKAAFIDNWKQVPQPKIEGMKIADVSSKEIFVENIRPYVDNSFVTILDSDMFEVPIWEFNKAVQFLFYDGPHDKETTKRAIMFYYSALADESVLVVDDANWTEVVEGTFEALKELGAQITYERLLLNDEENVEEWWNGLLICVIRKNDANQQS